LFAWMTDMILYRMNQVPDRLHVKFLELLGMTLQEPIAATVPVTFWLSTPQEQPVIIPAGTEISSTQTETEAPIVFSTDDVLVIEPPLLASVKSQITTGKEEKEVIHHDLARLTKDMAEISIFSAVPKVNDALYFGFENNLSRHLLAMTLNCQLASGSGIVPSLPPYVWEVLVDPIDDIWQTCEVDIDTTLGLNNSGYVEILLPEMKKGRYLGESYYWLRIRVGQMGREERAAGILPYGASPRLKGLTVGSIGGSALATHSQLISDEVLGYCTSEPGQRFFLHRTPVLDRLPGETLEFEFDGEIETWEEVIDFSESGPDDLHFTLDSITGEVRLGAAIRQPDGQVRQYGAIPPFNARVLFTQYRTGGGLEGNIEAGVLNTLKSSIPYIDRVVNRTNARGGLDAETVEQARVRAPMLLRSRERAVTAEDFEFLTQDTFPDLVARVRCLQPKPSERGSAVHPGQVYILVVPRVRYEAGYLSANELEISEPDLDTINQFLDDRRLLTTRMHVRTPAYRWVSVKVAAGAAPGSDAAAVEMAILEQLYQFLNPLVGGPDGEGWEFGRDLFVADIYQALQGLPDVSFLRNVELYAATPNGNRTGSPLEKLDLVAHNVIASGIHTVELINV
ncbi:MAG: putative baseplate assembly protein, partial [Chloroflexota bacterium]